MPQATLSALAAPDLAETEAGAADTIDAPRYAATGPEGVTTRPGRHAKPEFVLPVAGMGNAQKSIGLVETLSEGGEAEVTRGVAGSAITDRLPLPVRAVVEGLPPGIRTGRAGLQPAPAAVVVLVVLLALAVTALVTGLGRPRVQPIEPVPDSTILSTGTPAPASDDSAPGGETGSALVVHVAGKVANPGIVQLPPGSRVIDAIDAVGGAEDGVDLTALNLARVLSDGEQVLVGVDGAPQPAAGQNASGPAPVSLNGADTEQLATLPGIGPTLAARIVQWREQNGRFTAVDELLEVTGIGPAKYEEIAELVTL